MKNTSSDKIKCLIKEGRESELSKELILDSLREHEIQDLDTFVAHSVQALKKSQARPLTELLPKLAQQSAEEVMVELLFGSKAQSDAKNLTHSQPKLPFILGDAQYKPSEINRFNGQLLHYIWDANTVSNGFLKAVIDPEEYRAFLSGSPAHRSTELVAYNHVPGTGHKFYQHINYGGYVLSLGYRHGYPNLTEVTMSGFWFWSTSWNDQISSLQTGSGPVILAENVMKPYLTGATLTIGRDTRIPWIGQAWNDRVSAILG